MKQLSVFDVILIVMFTFGFTSITLAQNQTSFQKRPLQSGDRIHVESRLNTNLHSKGKGKQKAALKTPDETDIDISLDGTWTEHIQSTNNQGPNEVKVKYKQMKLQKSIVFGKNQKEETDKHPVQGRTYIVKRKSDDEISAHFPGNKGVSLGEDEQKLLQNHFRTLGEEHPLQKALAGKQMGQGQTVQVDSTILDMIIHGKSPSWPEDQPLQLRYRKTETSKESSSGKAAIFNLTGKESISKENENGTVSVQGTIKVDPSTSLPLSAQVKIDSSIQKTQKRPSGDDYKMTNDRTSDLNVSWTYEFSS